jgi:hypothetical protein
METSIFLNRDSIPTTDELNKALGDTYHFWQVIKDYVHLQYPKAIDEWNCSKNGWSFRIKDKKRAIIYFLPRNRYFKVAFVFGQKATDAIMQSDILEEIKKELNAARVYAEGRGIRIDIKNEKVINDVKKLITVKLDH